LRRDFGELLNVESTDLFVIPNTSTGISLVAEGFPFQPGENIVVSEGEFPSNLFPWQNQRYRGVETRIVPRRGNIVDLDDLFSQVNEYTRIIAVSWVGYASGYRVDLAELTQRAHQRGALVFVDAIQGLGVHPLDLSAIPIDFFAADGHKWLLGPEGIGIAMIRDRHRQKMRCPVVGWHSVRQSYDFSHSQFELREDAARYEPGSQNMLGVAGLLASLQLFLRVRREFGVDAIESRILATASRLTDQLRSLGAIIDRSEEPAHQSGIVTFRHRNIDPNSFRAQALQAGVVVSCRGGGIRASLHAYNNSDDTDRLIDLVRSRSDSL
jgi:selenocysteine lyase/cysteine desulfurase